MDQLYTFICRLIKSVFRGSTYIKPMLNLLSLICLGRLKCIVLQTKLVLCGRYSVHNQYGIVHCKLLELKGSTSVTWKELTEVKYAFCHW